METIATNGRSEEQILARSGIPLRLGDGTYWLRPLTMDAADRWEQRIVGLIGSALGLVTGGGVEGVLGIVHQGVDAMLDALYAYDELGSVSEGLPSTLPNQGVLRHTASRLDLYEALRKLVKHEFPPLTSAEAIGAWVPADIREIITKRLLLMLPESVPAPSSSDSSQSTPGRPNRAARRRSAAS